MNNLTESKAGSKLSDAARKLCEYTLKTDYDVTFEICKDKNATQPECTHSFTGNSKHCLLKMAAAVAVGAFVVCAVSSLCSFFSKLLKH